MITMINMEQKTLTKFGVGFLQVPLVSVEQVELDHLRVQRLSGQETYYKIVCNVNDNYQVEEVQ